MHVYRLACMYVKNLGLSLHMLSIRSKINALQNKILILKEVVYNNDVQKCIFVQCLK